MTMRTDSGRRTAAHGQNVEHSSRAYRQGGCQSDDLCNCQTLGLVPTVGSKVYANADAGGVACCCDAGLGGREQ
jgi:hypothetical protein